MREYFSFAPTFRWFSSPERFCGNIKSFFLWIKWSCQRAFRGYADCDVWNFNDYLSEIITNGLKVLKANSHGHPIELKTQEEWEGTLQIIIDGFEAAINITNLDFFENTDSAEQTKAKQKILQKKFDKGMQLFHKYYLGLWD